MKKICMILAMIIISFTLTTGVCSACTVGTKDCRPSSSGSNTCYWWQCETCGSETCWIYQGTTCTCPAHSSMDESNMFKQICKNQLVDESRHMDYPKKSNRDK